MAEKQQGNLNIYQKLANIRKSVEVVQKNKSGYGYKYVTEDELLAKISVGMEKFGLLLMPKIIPGTSVVSPYTYPKTKVTKDGKTYEEHVNEILVQSEMEWTWLDTTNGDTVVVPWVLFGQQSDASQAFGSGLTYSSRYFLLKFFNVATPESDPDDFRSKQKATEAESDKLIASQIINTVDELVRDYCVTHPDDKENVKTLCSKYVKDGNYSKITESRLAAKLLNDFKTTFNIKQEDSDGI